MSIAGYWVVYTGVEGLRGNWGGDVRGPHVVGVVGPGAVGWYCGRAPAIAVDMMMVGVAAVEVRVVVVSHEGVVGRHGPVEVGHGHVAAEAEVLSGAVHASADGIVEPDATQVEGHINFLAGIGIETKQPYFVELAVDGFGPDLVDDDIGGQLVLEAAVDHQLVLSVESCGHSGGLLVGEVAYRIGRSCKSCEG